MLDQDLVARFENPGLEFGPTPLWWWSGATVTKEGIEWQLQKFAEGRINNLVVMNLAPKGPTFGAKPDNPVWFSDEWWQLFEYACEVAKSLHIKLWFYDQIGFSGANLQGQITAQHPEFAGQGLHSRSATVQEFGGLALEGRENLIGVYGEQLPDGTWQRISWTNGVADAPIGTQVQIITWHEKSFDYLSAIACEHLIDFVHGEFERRLPQYLGSVIVGSFQDELPAMPTWSANFLSDFQALAGYDLAAHLPSLWQHSRPDNARIRYDYHQVRTQLAEAALFKPLGQWHNERNMLIGADQFNPARAGWPTQGVQLYADYFATHRHYNAVGSDHEGDSRIHSSMADLYDHPRVWIESFHSSGWGGTLEDTWDWLLPFFRSGATLYNPHASFYNTHAGWFEWAPPSTDFRQPYFALYPQFSTAVARVCSLLTWGQHVVNVGVLYPSATTQSILPPDLPVDHFGDGEVGAPFVELDQTQSVYLKLAGTNNWFRSAPGLLDGLGIDFDIIDEDSISRSVVSAATLNVNKLAFQTIILPSAEYLDSTTAIRLKEFLDCGGRVLSVGRAPRWATGLEGNDAAVQALVKHGRFISVATVEDLAPALSEFKPQISSNLAIRARRQGDSFVAFVAAAYPNASSYPLRQPGDFSFRWKDYDFDPERYAAETDLTIQGQVADLEAWNPATGERWPLSSHLQQGDTAVKLDFRGAPAVFVAWREKSPTETVLVENEKHGSISTLESLNAGWSAELVNTLDNSWGDFDLPPSTEQIPLEISKLDWRTIDSEPIETKATFGQRVLVSKPLAAEKAKHLSVADVQNILVGGNLAGDESHDGLTFKVHEFSLSRGVDKDPTMPLGPKGFVPEPFIRHETATENEVTIVRTILRVEQVGEYDLTVFGSSSKRVWFNGVELTTESEIPDRGYYLTLSVTFEEPLAVLEYHLGVDEALGLFASLSPGSESGFAIDHPGQRVAVPEFIAPKTVQPLVNALTYQRSFTLPSNAISAKAVTGSASALKLSIDGQVLARQEKVEYYESDWGGNPMYFTNEIGSVAGGIHELQVEVFASDLRAALFVDLCFEFEDGSKQVLVTDESWCLVAVNTSAKAPVEFRRGLSGQLTNARSAMRAHPLADAHWLTGKPEVGDKSVRFEAAISTVEQVQQFSLLIPAGSHLLEIPAEIEHAQVEGKTVQISNGKILFDTPLDNPAILTLSTAGRAFSIGGAVFDAPIRVFTASAPTAIGDWRELGLGAFSGGLKYGRTIAVSKPEYLKLDLGRVRGAVRVELDGAVVGSAFCVPYSFDLGLIAPGQHKLTVVVYSTLAQRFDSLSPTTWIFESQLEVGIMGPITLEHQIL